MKLLGEFDPPRAAGSALSQIRVSPVSRRGGRDWVALIYAASAVFCVVCGPGGGLRLETAG